MPYHLRCAPRANTTSPRRADDHARDAPARLARFHHTPSTSGANRPDIAKQNAQATAPRMPVELHARHGRAGGADHQQHHASVIRRFRVSAFGSMIL